ncbi:MAG: hypothetical protein IJ717_03240 [Treponema sp.]|nr:hypothetical protein [Treponema sp.]
MKKAATKTIKAIGMAAIAMTAAALASCSTNDVKSQASNDSEIEMETKDIENAKEDVDPSYTLRTEKELGKATEKEAAEYSNRTLIVHLDGEASKELALALASDYNMNVVYVYQIINACTLSTKRDFTDAEMSYLIEKLNSDKRVLSATRDNVMHLN